MDNKRKLEYDIVYMNVAKDIAKLSYSKRNQVGCIIISEDRQIVSQGYNGTPTGFDNCCEYIHCCSKDKCIYNDKLSSEVLDIDYCTSINNGSHCKNITLITKPEVLHAESNAISKCAKYFSSTLNTTMYITLSPCLDCAKLIIQSGIKRVVYDELYRNVDGLELLKKASIIVQQLVKKEDNTYMLVEY